MTTSSGKPPFDEHALDSSWDAGSDARTDGPDSSSREPLTPRQPAAAPAAASPRAAGADSTASEPEAAGDAADAAIYGTAVPYGGDDRTEEIDPVALDTPFTPDERKTPPAPVVATPMAPPAAPARNFEMKAPAAQVLLSDLFDSVPSSGAMGPPDPAAFSSSRPPPERPPSEPPPPDTRPSDAPKAARDAIVGLPNIDVGGEGARSGGASAKNAAPAAPAAAAEEAEPRGQRSFPAFETVQQKPDTLDPEMSTATVRLRPNLRAGDLAADPEMSTATVRLKVDGPPVDPEMSKETIRLTPDLRAADPEMSTATIKLSRDRMPGLGSNPSNSRPSNPPPRAPMPSSPALGEPGASEAAAETTAAASPSPSPHAAASSAHAVASSPHASSPHASSPHASSPHGAPSGPAQPAAGDVARFPSEVPTSRPPDVQLAPAAAVTSRPAARASREPKAPPQATVATPASSQFKARDASQLPSIMLAADVEAEPDSAAKRALRAARATVRLELPPGFGRPGSPVGPVSPGSPVGPGAPSASMAGGPSTAIGHFVPSAPPVVMGAEPWFANTRTKRMIGAGLAGLLLFVTLMFALSPRTGSLVVTALAPGNRAVDDVTIFIDGRPLCDVSPCRIKGLTPGVHTLRASAPNLASQAEETVEITAGDESTYNIDLLAVAPEVRSGGMRVPAADTPLTLFIDGKRVGKLPQEVSGLSAGKHWIKLDPEDGSAAIEKSVNVLAGEIVDVEPRAAKREKALVTIRLGRGSEGAQVTFDEAFLLDFPAELELEPNTVHTLTATKPGYEDLSLDVEIAEGETEKLIEVSLEPLEGARKSRPAKVARKPTAPKAAPTTQSAGSTASTALADATQGLLNISSTPPSQIILNGRPLGSTPKTGITVPGDSLQTIVFVHPKMGRRRAQKFVPAGKERTVSIRF